MEVSQEIIGNTMHPQKHNMSVLMQTASLLPDRIIGNLAKKYKISSVLSMPAVMSLQ
jgi:hypothetical protein